ncbi:MAG: hypothetical protein R2688_05690 [Fimbriimonadaceae bacterium]
MKRLPRSMRLYLALCGAGILGAWAGLLLGWDSVSYLPWVSFAVALVGSYAIYAAWALSFGRLKALKGIASVLLIGVVSLLINRFTGFPYGNILHDKFELSGVSLLWPLQWLVLVGSTLLVGYRLKAGWKAISVGPLLAGIVALALHWAQADGNAFLYSGGVIVAGVVASVTAWAHARSKKTRKRSVSIGLWLIAGFCGVHGAWSDPTHISSWMLMAIAILLFIAGMPGMKKSNQKRKAKQS